MNQNTKLLITIKLSVSKWLITDASQRRDMNKIIREVHRQYHHLLSENEKLSILWMKELQILLLNYLAGTPKFVNQCRIGLTRDGIPKIFGYLIPKIRDNSITHNELKVLMTCLTEYRSRKGDGTLNSSSIVSPPTTKLEAERKILSWVPQWWADSLLPVYQPIWTFPHQSMKKGPLGQATGTALKDLNNLPDQLVSAIMTLGGEQLRNYMNKWLCVRDTFKWSRSTGEFRKISVIRDKGGKNRPIAVFDYWSQTALRPFHDYLISVLDKIPCDCTSQQGKVELLSKNWKSFHCFDLSAATDRFPMTLQKQVVSLLVNDEFAEAWSHIIVSYPFKSKEGPIFYKTGQPMGAYSSWAMFALTHHMVVQYCAEVNGFTNFREYALLGDDIVIGNEAVAETYLQMINDLGVEISLSKSYRGNAVIEFAKRTWLHGTEISGLSIDALVDAHTEPFSMAMYLHTQTNRGYPVTSTSYPVFNFIKNLYGINTSSGITRLGSLTAEYLTLILAAGGNPKTLEVNSSFMNEIDRYSLGISCNRSLSSLQSLVMNSLKRSAAEAFERYHHLLTKAQDDILKVTRQEIKNWVLDSKARGNTTIPAIGDMMEQPWIMICRDQKTLVKSLIGGIYDKHGLDGKVVTTIGGSIFTAIADMLEYDELLSLLSKLRIPDITQVMSTRVSTIAIRRSRTHYCEIRNIVRRSG